MLYCSRAECKYHCYVRKIFSHITGRTRVMTEQYTYWRYNTCLRYFEILDRATKRYRLKLLHDHQRNAKVKLVSYKQCCAYRSNVSCQ